MTEEEHKARAALLGMSYHHGNGFPIYFARDERGWPVPKSVINAETLEPEGRPDIIIEQHSIGRFT